jgi:class 3 adenylate cyclase
VRKYVTFFKSRKKVNAVLLFIDVTSFSLKFKSKTPEEVVDFLDNYYKRVFPIVAKHGGEIEKIIGDGIIVIFGPPFLEGTSTELHNQAENCAKEILQRLHQTDFESKIALHYGEIMYYQNTSDEYYEYTMVGNALTDLFRLESVSISNSINFFYASYFHLIKLIEEAFHSISYDEKLRWKLTDKKPIELQGVSHKYINQLTMQ